MKYKLREMAAELLGRTDVKVFGDENAVADADYETTGGSAPDEPVPATGAF